MLLAEHRLERCLAAADRVIALDDGAVICDADPRGFLEQAPPGLQTPGARLFAHAGLRPPPVAVKDARAALRARGLLPEEAAPPGLRPSRGGRRAGTAAEAGRHACMRTGSGTSYSAARPSCAASISPSRQASGWR